MGLNYRHLTAEVRKFMLEELESDIKDGKHYKSTQFNDNGLRICADLMREALKSHDDNWLALQFRKNGCFAATYMRRTKGGGTSDVKVPSDAAEKFSEGEFNRYYLRGLCRQALKDRVPHLMVYRAKEVQNPRPESQMIIGKLLEPNELLMDIRTNYGESTWLGVPMGPNSGLSACIP